jgi:small subunit ribosomal protein S6
MRHYEIVFMVHPTQEAEIAKLTSKFTKLAKDAGGNIHRNENWGCRDLAYPINKVQKAFYVLINIECNQAVLDEIENDFRFNEAVMRHLTLSRKKAVTKPSPMMAPKPVDNRRGQQGGYNDRRAPARTDSAPSEAVKESQAQAADKE